MLVTTAVYERWYTTIQRAYSRWPCKNCVSLIIALCKLITSATDILWNIYQNLWELSLTRHLILQPIVNVPLYHSHFLRYNFAHISKHTFSASRTHLNLLSCSDWPHRSLPYQRSKPYIVCRGIYQVTSVSCFYGSHINFNFTYLLTW